MNNICDFGCGQKATYQFRNGKWCCSSHFNKCSAYKENLRRKNVGKKLSNEHKLKCLNHI